MPRLPAKRGGRGQYAELNVINPGTRLSRGAEFPDYLVCRTCNESKPVSNYHHIRSKLGRMHPRRHCKPCFGNKGKAWRDGKKRVINGVERSYMTIRQKYGITLDDYISMFESQEGVCAICKELEYGKLLVVDHDHSSGRVRGLICYRCNNGLGSVKDSIETLVSMIDYLEKNNE
jgi:hypothetical protein